MVSGGGGIDDGDDRSDHFAGISSLISLAGALVPARARFMGGAILNASLSSLTFGLCCGAVGSSFPTVGPLVPYLIGSCTGYTFGTWQYWRNAKQLAITYAQQYPTLLAYAISSEYCSLHGMVVPKSIVQASLEKLEEHAGDDEEVKQVNSNSTTTSPTLDQWILQGGLGRLTFSIVAAQSCQREVESIKQQHRQRIVDDILASCNSDNEE